MRKYLFIQIVLKLVLIYVYKKLSDYKIEKNQLVHLSVYYYSIAFELRDIEKIFMINVQINNYFYRILSIIFTNL